MPASLPRYLRCPRSRLVLLALVLAFTSAWLGHRDLTPAAFLRPENDRGPVHDEHALPFSSRFVSHATDMFVHAASVTATADNGLFAVWFGGSREGAEDVRIFGSHFDRHSGQWSAEQVVIDRAQTEQALGKRIRKRGNPVVGMAPDGKLWLFYVSVSLGGWATSNINLMTSTDNGHSWTASRRLITSPFFNLSTLVRGRPIFHADGSIGLPVYHEAAGKFPEYLRLDRQGHILDKVRLDYGRDTLQPFPVVLDDSKAIFLLRDGTDSSNRLHISHTADTGIAWSTPQVTTMTNPNSAITAVRYSDSEILVVLNDLESERYRLSAYLTDHDFSQWQRIAVLDEAPVGAGKPVPFAQFKPALAEQFSATAGADHRDLLAAYLAGWSDDDRRGCKRNACEFHYDYPYLIQTDADQFELVYSWNKSLIKHLSLSRRWIEQQRAQQQRPSVAAEVQP
ncbi:exo-alpha-sialidase [Permianibacter sp. IMCC34836]|uniref:sialidase family protein n=1 Tax=Permianibacter fluminis TaxID=2738515 RepID=UPI001552EC39|nr:sialidase family protein [Permianibacter fluminis]NQD35752.1 exo-alpha-sialidase [Permianibacter fluminis]